MVPRVEVCVHLDRHPPSGIMTGMEDLSVRRIREGLTTKFRARRVVYRALVDSTNDIAIALAKEGAPEGTLVIAEEQRAGRGRGRRRWFAAPGTSLLLSLVLYPPLHPSRAGRLTMVASLAAAEAIEAISGLHVTLKWPNDVTIKGKKVGGILVESGTTGECLDYAVVGVGLNVNMDLDQLPEIAGTATSIRGELGTPVSRLKLLREFLTRFEGHYLQIKAGGSPYLEWSSRMAKGRLVVKLPDRMEKGQAEGVDMDGALLLRQDDTTMVRITMGEVMA